MLKKKLKKYSFGAVFMLLCFAILILCLRGLPGSPTEAELNSIKWRDDGPFELSPERGRFALIYSFIENKSFSFSPQLSDFAMPDLAVAENGEYVSMFAPGVSFLAIPGYLLGKFFGNSQAGAYLVIAFFALLNIILIKAIALKLGSSRIAAYLAGFIFVFATPAFAYSVTLYQHHITVFLILLSLYFLTTPPTWIKLSLIWLICGLSIIIDYPNFFLLFPIGIYALVNVINAKKTSQGVLFTFRPAYALTLLIIIIPVSLFLSYNQKANGNPFQLSGTLSGIKEVSAGGETGGSGNINEKNKNALGFFQTRNLLNGFYIHLLSPDRGVLYYAPIILFGIGGLIILYREKARYANIFTAIIGVNILLYSMWGDPYGGWAFGSRYLIPAYALLAVTTAKFLTKFKKNKLALIVFFIVFIYSSGVNTLGAATSNANPPKIEILSLEAETGKEEKYTYMRNWEYLKKEGSKSYIFNSYLENHISPEHYLALLNAIIWITALFIITKLRFDREKIS